MENLQSDPSEVIDIDELNEIMDNDDELIKECFDDFITDSPEMLGKIKAAIDANDGENLGKTAHAIKGSLKYLAAHIAADMAYRLESMGSGDDFSKAKETFEKLNKECDKLKNFMSNYII